MCRFAFICLFVFFSNMFPAFAVNELDTGAACEKKVVSLINKTQRTIDAALYAINRKPIINALIAASQRGVRIRLLMDRTQLGASKNLRELYQLLEAGVDLRVSKGKGLMHTKMAIFDRKTISGGSFNWTNPAVTANDEICNFFVNDLEYAAKHQKFFNRLWKKHPAQFSEKWFQNNGRCGDILLLRT
ncbi:MAG: hypothetical protein IJ752_09220 [Alphaproteobacteria bacterium]|nr:hypothetical protein [Alphaproteobacteria bacterium]